MPTLAGTKLDRYEMLEEVGHGGMAVVYRGQDSVLQREVAVKVLHAHLSDREESRLRLQREAIAVAKLRHDNILEIFDYSGLAGSESYIVTEFIHGPTLREWIDDAFEPRPAVAALVIHRLALALAHAHASGIIHRDIKPENVMIRASDGCLKLMDFGIAQLLDNQKLTMTGQLIGSPAYMAPELISGRPLDARTDLFSLGIMLYQLSTGALPFSGRNPHEVLNRISDGEYPPPSQLCPLVDRDLEAIIAKALATSPNERYQTVQALAKELEEYLREVGVEPELSELAQYFREPKKYVHTLDQRVGRALLARAEEAAKAGQTARAIRLLGRVLEIHRDHREAKALLARLRTRERRTRQGLFASGVVAAGGLVMAGFVLLPSERLPSVMQRRAFASQSQQSLEISGDAFMPAVMQAPRIPNATPTVGSKIDPPAAPAVSAEAKAETATIEPEPASPAVSAPGKDASGPGVASRPTAPFELGAAPHGPNVSPPSRDVPARRVPPDAFTCTVMIKGISASTARHAKLQIDRRLVAITDPDAVNVDVKAADGGEVEARLASNRYRGSVDLSFQRCQEPEPVVLHAEPLPARIKFKNLPGDTSVSCKRVCDGSELDCEVGVCPNGDDQVLAEKLEFPMTSDTLHVELELRARCHKPRLISRDLTPGLNEIDGDLERVEGECND